LVPHGGHGHGGEEAAAPADVEEGAPESTSREKMETRPFLPIVAWVWVGGTVDGSMECSGAMGGGWNGME
jgi:hypothetical protein